MQSPFGFANLEILTVPTTSSLRTTDAFPVVAFLPATENVSAVRRRVYLFCRGSRVEGNIFFLIFFFLEKLIIDTINVIKTNKKNLKKKWHVNM